MNTFLQKFSRKNGRPVKLIHIESGKEYSFPTISKAANTLDLEPSAIRKCLQGDQASHKGFRAEEGGL